MLPKITLHWYGAHDERTKFMVGDANLTSSIKKIRIGDMDVSDLLVIFTVEFVATVDNVEIVLENDYGGEE